jgi:hypothetical protein
LPPAESNTSTGSAAASIPRLSIVLPALSSDGEEAGTVVRLMRIECEVKKWRKKRDF